MLYIPLIYLVIKPNPTRLYFTAKHIHDLEDLTNSILVQEALQINLCY